MEKTLKEKQLDLLNETISFFNSNNRCIDKDNGCKYYVEGKEGCAIGRKIEDKELCQKLDLGLYCGVSHETVFEQLPKELKELNSDFLEEIQGLHDGYYYWNESGLSIEGQDRVIFIKNKFKLN